MKKIGLLVLLAILRQTAFCQGTVGNFSQVNIIDSTDSIVGPEQSFQGYRQHWRVGVDVANHGGSEDMVLLAADVPGAGVRDFIYVNANKTGNNSINDTSLDPTIGFFQTPAVSNVQTFFRVSDRHPDRPVVGFCTSQYTDTSGRYLAFYNSTGTTQPLAWLNTALEFGPFLKTRGISYILSSSLSSPNYLDLNANPTDISTDFHLENLYNSATGYNFTITDPTSYKYLVINNRNHNVGVGCANPSSTLTVNGTVESLGVKVDSVMSWCDYVFDKQYRLPSLEETREYIHLHGHLAEIPSTEEVRKNGLDLVDNQVKLLKKIEELTLYILEQDKKIKQLENQNNRIDELEKKIALLSQK
jgi:hypothetical protein